MILVKILLEIVIIFGMPILTNYLADKYIPYDEKTDFGYIMGNIAYFLIFIINIFLR